MAITKDLNFQTLIPKSKSRPSLLRLLIGIQASVLKIRILPRTFEMENKFLAKTRFKRKRKLRKIIFPKESSR